MFARVQVPGSPSYEALLIPDAAIGSEQTRKFVYVVGADDTAQIRYVEPGQLVEGLRVIRSGLAASDRIVVNGMARTRAGAKVNPQPQRSGPSAASPQSQLR
jgi:multidrug efflux pump subunit AcrA (membrane-fusion protein)